MRQRTKWTLNPWALTRPICWLFGHDECNVLPGDAFSLTHALCRRCLQERYSHGKTLRAEIAWRRANGHW